MYIWYGHVGFIEEIYKLLNISPVQRTVKIKAIYPVLKYWTLLPVIFS